jgi:DNA-binding NarL/FixJ family response regulator
VTSRARAACGIPRHVDAGDLRHAVRDTLRALGGADIHDHTAVRPPIRVGVVDDHPAILESIAIAVAEAEGLRLVGTARTVDDAVELASHVDVLVCDMNLAGGAEGLQVLRSIHDPRALRQDPPAVLFLSGFDYPSLIRAAVDSGAAGYIDKSADLEDILSAIRTLAAGGTAYSAAALHGTRDARRRPSDREIQVIGSVVDGATNAEVGVALGLSEKTVESHLRRLFDRYGLLSRTELAVLAIQEGWVADPRLRR